MVLAVAGIVGTLAAPSLLARIGVTNLTLFALFRWPALLILVTVLLSALYWLGPCRPKPRWRWVTPGSALAAFGWMLMSDLFSWYVAHFGSYDRTYGSFGAIVGFLTWVWLSVMVVLFGAELNSELEKRSNTEGRATRRGSRRFNS
jgi:membrane protein